MSAVDDVRAALDDGHRAIGAVSVRIVLEAHDAHRTRADAAEAEVARLRAIVEGRTVPPTDEEIDAHEAAGGSWIVGVRTVHRAREARDVRAMCERRAALHATTPPGWPPFRWLAFDLYGRPCPWPTVLDAGEGR